MSEKLTKPINSIVPEENGSQPRNPGRRQFLKDMRNLTLAAGTGYIIGSNSPKESTPTPTTERRGGVPTEAQLAEMLGEENVRFIKDENGNHYVDINVQRLLEKAAETGAPNISLSMAVRSTGAVSLEAPEQTRAVVMDAHRLISEEQPGNNKGQGTVRVKVLQEKYAPQDYRDFGDMKAVYISDEISPDDPETQIRQASSRTLVIELSSSDKRIVKNESGSYSTEGDDSRYVLGVSMPHLLEFENYPGASYSEQLPGGNQ